MATSEGPAIRVLAKTSDYIEILEDGKSLNDVIDSKIKELASVDNEEPFYVVNLDSIFKKHHRWMTNLPRVKPFYAVKCNNTPAVIRMLRALGTGFDCASKAEIELALSCGVTPDQIIYAHTTKALSHIRFACANGIETMTFDNEEELLKISRCHPQARLVLRIAVDDSESLVRLSTKFGARRSSAGKLLDLASKLSLEVIGVSFHVGSGCTGASAFKQAIANSHHVFEVANNSGFQMRLLDIGGGFSGTGKQFEEFSEVINESLDKFFPAESGVEIIAEPGRYYVESAFTLAVNVIAKRVVNDNEEEEGDGDEANPGRNMMYYINDGVYGSLSCVIFDPAHSHVEPCLHRAVESHEPRYPSVIWGPTCDSIDKVTESCWIPELHVGDWLLVDNMGAYSVSVCTDFNSFQRACIYPVVTAKTWQTLNLSDTVGIVHETVSTVTGP